MGINRIRLANGATGDPRIDARMQQTYQQNIADNQAQEAINQQNLNVGRERSRQRMRGMGNSGFQTPQAPGILSQVGQALNPSGNTILQRMQENQANQTSFGDKIQNTVQAGINNVSGLPQHLQDTEKLAQLGLTPENYNIISAMNASDNMNAGVGSLIAPASIYTLGDTVSNSNQDFKEGVGDLGRYMKGVNIQNNPELAKQLMGEDYVNDMLNKYDLSMEKIGKPGYKPGPDPSKYSSTAMTTEPSAMPQGSPGQLNPTPTPDAGTSLTQYSNIPELTRLINNNPNINSLAEADNYLKNQKPTMADVAGPAATGGGVPNYQGGTMVGPNLYLGPTGIYERIDPNGSYTSMGRTDPRTQGLASGGRVGLAEGTDPNLTARQVADQNPELHAMRQNFFGTDYLSDIDQGNTGTVQYYTGLGNPTSLEYTPPVVEETPAVDVSTPIVDIGGDGGGGGISTGGSDIETGNTDFEQSLLDQGVGVQGAIGDPVVAPGEMLSTQAEMDAFNQIPVNREYGDPMNIGYGEGQVDPGLAAAVGGQDTTPLGGSNLVTTSSGDIFAADDPRLLEQTDFQEPQYRIRDQLNEDFLQGGILKDVGSAFEGIKDQGINGLNSLKEKLTALGGKLKPGFDNVIEIGGKTIDLTKSLLGGALSLVSGIPGIGLLLNSESASGAQQGLVSDAFVDSGGVLDDIGRIQRQEGLAYNTPENVMAGYSPGETGIRLGNNFTIGGGTAQESAAERINDIQETINNLPNTFSRLKESDPIAYQQKIQNLEDRQEALKGFINISAVDAAGGVQLSPFDYENTKAGTTLSGADYFGEDSLNDLVTAKELAAATARAAADLAASQRRSGGGNGGGQGDQSGGRSSSSGESGYGGFCFDPSTPIQMADGSTKKIKNIQLGDDTKGGEVTGVFQFKASDDIHNYKGVTVAGGHYVKENNEFIMVKDSPLAVKMDKIPVVYSLDTSARRIFIKDIEFADYNGDGVAKNFLSNAGVTLKGFDKEVLRQVQQRLI